MEQHISNNNQSANHTQGPLEYGESTDSGFYVESKLRPGSMIAEFFGEGAETNEANARLFVAAPELLNELKGAGITLMLLANNVRAEMKRNAESAKRWDDMPELLDEQARSINVLIAKATGEER